MIYIPMSLIGLKTWCSEYTMCSLVCHATTNDAVPVLLDSIRRRKWYRGWRVTEFVSGNQIVTWLDAPVCNVMPVGFWWDMKRVSLALWLVFLPFLSCCSLVFSLFGFIFSFAHSPSRCSCQLHSPPFDFSFSFCFDDLFSLLFFSTD